MTVPKPELPTRFDAVQFNFGPYSLRPDGTLLLRSAALVLPPKELEVLRLFLTHAGEIVGLEQLRRCAWGDTHVSQDSLPRLISSLRARIEIDDCIQTVYKRGYRFSFPVERVLTDVPLDPASRPNTRVRSMPRLAILPFAAAPGVPEYLGVGIAEETMLRLGRTRTPVAEMIARDSIFALAGQGRGGLDVARALNADLAVTGSITPLPLHFRFRAEMVRVSEGTQLWVEDFLIPRNLLAYADIRIAKRIGARIRAAFAGPIAPVSHIPDLMEESRRSEAYTRYLQAQSQWRTFERHLMQDAIRGFQQAVELDPGLVSARVHLVHSYLALATFGYMRADTAAELARKQAEQVLSNPASAPLVTPALGWIHFFHDRDPQAAAAAFARPQNLGHNLWAAVYEARFAIGQGRLAEAAKKLRSTLEVDPYSPVLHWRLTWALHLSGDATAAIEQARRTIALFPNDPGALFFTAIVFAAADGREELCDQAVTLATRLTQLAPLLDSGFATLAYALARKGNSTEAAAILGRQRWLGRERFVMRSFQAPALVELGQYDAAIEALSEADEQRCPWLFELLGDPRLRPLHNKAEFRRLSEYSGHRLSDVSVA
jgi:DNA-binding winged helix-turn-helix (wHTH) protein/tetratricopeptide (TPR) repeat protein